MANSSSVSSGDLATADQYNNLRDDVLSTSSGHLHDGSAGRGDGAFVLQVSGVALTLENSTDATSNQVLLLRGDNATRADGDEIYMSFNMDDDGGNSHEFARITADAVDVSNGSEDGELRFGVSVAGTMTDVFTINSSTAGATSISYEVDAFTIKGEEGGAGVLYLFADQGDDAGDEWKVNVADGGVLTFGNDLASAGSYVTHMTMTPNSTVACSTVAFAGNVTVASDLTVSGGCITLACSKIFSGGDTTSLNLIDALDATTEATIEGAIDTLSNLGTIGKACATTNIVAGDITMYNAENNGNPTISLGSASAERLIITANYDSGAQTLCNVEFATAAASGTANKGKFVFDVDGTDIATIDDGGIDIASGKTFSINGSDISTSDTTYTAGDGLTLTGTDFDLDAALTTVTSVYNASLKVGRDSGNLIDFATTDNKLIFRVNCVNEVELVENALSPVTSDNAALGTGSLMWSDLFLASGSAINFNNSNVTLTHSACTLTVAGGTLAAGAISTTGALTVGVDDTGHDVKFFGAAAGAYMLYDQSEDQLEIRGASADATTSTGKLLLSTSLTNVNANDVIGSINFQAPAEAGGTDAVAIAAGIRAVAQATFTCAVNSTDLIFYTGHSEAATEKFRFTSQGEIGIGGANYGNDGQVLTSTGGGTAVAWEDAAGGVGCGPLRIASGAACAPAYSFSTSTDTNTGMWRPGCDIVELIAGGGGSLRLDSDSKVYIKETANSKMDRGLTINMGGNSNEILTFKSSDVGHTMLNTTEADTFGFISKYQAAGGGLRINGYMDGDVTAANENSAIAIAGFVQDAANTDKCGSANGIVTIDAQIRSGCSSTNVNSDGNILTIRDCTSTRFIFDKEGTAHAEVGTATFDDYCDVELLRGFLATTCDQYKQNYVDKFGQDLMYNQEWYEENKLIGRNSIHWEERECGKMQQRAMVNFTGLAMLHHSTIIQLSDRVNARLDDIDTQLKALTEGK